MKLKRKLILLALLIIISAITIFYFPTHTDLYSRTVFYPFQSFRSIIFGLIPFSIGDVLYFLGGLWLLVTIIRWIYFTLHFRQHKERFAGSALTMINTLVFVYLFFLLGWGFNYDKDPLRKAWELGDIHATTIAANDTPAIKQKRFKDSLALVAFDSFLVDKLNAYAPYYRSLPFPMINERAKAYYSTYTDSKVKHNGLGIKPSLFSYFLELMAVDGYYNPFTGEGQVNNALPGFELPFIVCHEMAHQAGVAAEGDANLMAYALGTVTNDTSFSYSCYLNIWMYTNNRLYRRDSNVANAFEDRLNALTTAHLDTLEQLSNKYNNTMTQYTGKIYDSYLKMQDQKEGIRSYGNVSISAWQLELKRKDRPKEVIRMP